MAWFFTKFNRNVYEQNVLNEMINPTLFDPYRIEPYRDPIHPIGYQTTADQAVSLESSRYFAAAPTQGDWYAPPYNPPANQSWKL